MSSPHFRPFLYIGLLGILLTALLSHFLGIERGLVAVVLGAIAVAALALYWRGANARTRQDIALRRDAFFSKLESGSEPDDDA